MKSGHTFLRFFKPFPNTDNKTDRKRRTKKIHVTGVMCFVSHVMCQVSCVSCHLSLIPTARLQRPQDQTEKIVKHKNLELSY